MSSSVFVSYKSINRLAIPSIISGLSEPIVSMTDSAFVGTLGKTSLAAVGIASMFILLIVWIFSSAKSAMASIVGQAYGSNSLKPLEGLILQSIIYLFVIGLACGGVAYLFSSDIFTLFYYAEGEILFHCNTYYGIRWLGIPLMLGSYISFGILKGLQNTSIAMWITLVGAILNIALDALLIFGIDEVIPALGIEGAALATIIAQGVMFLLALIMLIKKYPGQLVWSKLFHPHPKLGLLFNQSSHLLLRTALLNLTVTLAIRYATSYGESVVATHHIISQFLLFAAFFVDGYANAGIAMAGRFYGAQQINHLKTLNKKLVKAGLMIALLMMSLYTMGYTWLVYIFTDDKAVIDLFRHNFWLLIIMLPLNSLAFIMDGIFIGIGKTKEMLIGMTLASLAVFIPLMLWFDHSYPTLTAIWIALICWMCTRGGYLVIKISRWDI